MRTGVAEPWREPGRGVEAASRSSIMSRSLSRCRWRLLDVCGMFGRRSSESGDELVLRDARPLWKSKGMSSSL